MTINDFKTSLEESFSKRDTEIFLRAIKEDLLNDAFLSSNDELSETQQRILEDSVIALKTGTPIAYVTGWVHFYTLKLQVDQTVLIPRSETEELVDLILKENPALKEGSKILDVGTGSGCIALALNKHLPHCRMVACEKSEAAIDKAQKNSDRLNLKVEFECIDFLASASELDTPWDVIVSNPPYIEPIEKERMDPHVIMHEPHLALFTPENNGLVFYQAICDYALENLKPHGIVYLELNEFRSKEIESVFSSTGKFETVVYDDLRAKPRMLKATLI